MAPPTRFAGTPRFRAPAQDGGVLAAPGFGDIPALVEENRRRLDRDDVLVGGLPLRELRALARREVLEAAREYSASLTPHPPLRGDLPHKGGGEERFDSPPPLWARSANEVSRVGGNVNEPPAAPLLLAGHQPELSHPGVWVKNFALHGLARRLGGTPLHLVVDNDTLKSASLRFPVFRDRNPQSVHLQSVPFDKLDGEAPYEDRAVLDPGQFAAFRERSRAVWDNWGYTPLLWWVWVDLLAQKGTVAERFTAARRRYEQKWGCRNLELPVSRLSRTEAFTRFAAHVLADLPRFREVYNRAIRTYREVNGVRSTNHPAPDLAPDEAPFWVRTSSGRRKRAMPTSDPGNLRPRALTLTLFARVCLGDFFIHGIGGGKYDEVTDAIIRDYFGVEPPAYQVLSATLHLPLPGFPSTTADVARLERLTRDLTWNPQRHLPAEVAARPEVAALVREKTALAATEPPYADHAGRRQWFRELSQLTGRVRPLVADQLAAAERELARARSEARANAILRRRDYSWVLYPEETLRPFLQRFME